MPEGILERYSEHKGLGYIMQDDGKMVRVLRSFIQMTGYKTVIPGKRLTFEVKDNIREPESKHVKKL